MPLWTLKGFLKGQTNIVEEWCDDQGDAVWEAFDAHVSFLAGQMPNKWVFPYVRLLRGGKRGKKTGCVGLVEMRFDVANVEYRPIGYYSGKMEFTFLFFATENGGEFVPPDACNQAKRRMALIENDKELASAFRL